MPFFKKPEKALPMSSNDIAIRVSNLSKCYQIYDTPRDRLKQFIMPRIRRVARQPNKQYFREFWALKDVSFEIKKGETVGIVGRNGSGKSTLLQMICGTLTPTSGSIQTAGRIAALLELGSGFNPEFTGRENIYMNASVLGLSRDEVDTRFADIIAFADIGDFIEQPVKTYSSGMVVRLAFAVIVHVDADILIVDEALAVGDAFFTQKCMRFLRNFMKTGTVLFVSHDTAAIVSLCSHALWLHHGTAKAIGTPKEVSELYLQALYESQQGESLTRTDLAAVSLMSVQKKELLRDMRLDWINQTSLRNDIELFPFSDDVSGFGKGGVVIETVRIKDENDNSLAWVVGGELIQLHIECKVRQSLFSPIVGFMVKDRLGQIIFADNTYLTYANNPISVDSGMRLNTVFHFRMPVMPAGDYSIAVAVAEGTQSEHIQHQWLHDALVFKVQSSSVCFGLIGVAMSKIELVKS
jgi:lipopolysaccharide transport system ATP-binding protein